MKKQILFLAGAFCMVSLNLLGQKKYNDLMAKPGEIVIQNGVRNLIIMDI